MSLKPEDIRNMTIDEMENKVVALQEELFKFRFEQKTGRVEKPHKIRQIKKDIARLKTISREKQNAKK